MILSTMNDLPGYEVTEVLDAKRRATGAAEAVLTTDATAVAKNMVAVVFRIEFNILVSPAWIFPCLDI